MSLTFGYSSPRDLLEKARRDLVNLEGAAVTQDTTTIGDALFNFAVTAYHVKDWLKLHAAVTYSPQDVENFVQSSAALSSCRDLCNAGKHAEITRYSPSTADVSASLNSVAAVVPGGLATPIVRVKIIRNDGTRREAVQLATEAISDWERFFDEHGL